MTNESAMNEILVAIEQHVQQAVPQIVRTLAANLEEKLTPALEKIGILERKVYSIRDDVHQILEGLEMRRNREVYSDIVVYGVKETRGLNDKKAAENLIKEMTTKLDLKKELEEVGESGVILSARRMKAEPKPGENRPLIITLATDNLREAIIRKGNKMKNDHRYKFKDNVCRETRLKRRVLGVIAGELRKESITAVVPYDCRAKLLVGEDGTKGRNKEKLQKLTYAEAVKKFGQKYVGKEVMDEIRLKESTNIEQILLL